MSGFKTFLQVLIGVVLIALGGFLIAWGVTYALGEEFIISFGTDNQVTIDSTDTPDDAEDSGENAGGEDGDGEDTLYDYDLDCDLVLSPGENGNIVF